jgi:hypothetical protein
MDMYVMTTTCQKAKMSLKKAKWVLFNAEAARRFGSEKRNEVRYYYCNQCDAYHVTSKK